MYHHDKDCLTPRNYLGRKKVEGVVKGICAGPDHALSEGSRYDNYGEPYLN